MGTENAINLSPIFWGHFLFFSKAISNPTGWKATNLGSKRLSTVIPIQIENDILASECSNSGMRRTPTSAGLFCDHTIKQYSHNGEHQAKYNTIHNHCTLSEWDGWDGTKPVLSEWKHQIQFGIKSWFHKMVLAISHLAKYSDDIRYLHTNIVMLDSMTNEMVQEISDWIDNMIKDATEETIQPPINCTTLHNCNHCTAYLLNHHRCLSILDTRTSNFVHGSSLVEYITLSTITSVTS